MNIIRFFKRLYMDGIKQEQPEHTMSDAVGIAKVNDSFESGYITNEPGTEDLIGLPNGLNIRGRYFVAHRNEWIVLALNGSEGEIGSLDLKTNTYRTIVKDSELDRPLGLDKNIWTQIRVNFHGQCRFKIYFQTNMIYRVIEIDDPCRSKETSTLLMKATCVGFINITAVPGIGHLPNGAYCANIMVFDGDGNHTNYGTTSQMAYIADDNYRVAEDVKWGLLIEAYNLPEDYNRIELTIIEKVGQDEKTKVIDNIYYGETSFRYTYTGSEGYYLPKSDQLGKMSVKRQYDFTGPGIETHDGALFLFNVKDNVHLNLQKHFNKLRVGYKRYLVKASMAHLFPTMRAGEKYAISINGNFPDGRRTIAYELINHNKAASYPMVDPGEGGNCSNCPVPSWRITDTSKRTKSFYKNTTPPEADYEQSNPDLEYNPNKYNPVVAIDDQSTTRSSEDSGGTPIDLLEKYCAKGNCEYATFLAVFVGAQQAAYDLINTIREYFGYPPISGNFTLPNCVCSTLNDLDNSLLEDFLPVFTRVDTETRTDRGRITYVKTDNPCEKEGEIRFGSTDICYECKGGYWHLVNNAVVIDQEANITKGGTSVSLDQAKGVPKPPVSTGNEMVPTAADGSQDCLPKYQPIPFSEGLFGYWETEDSYPDIIGRDDCEPVYGEYAGTPRRLFAVPGLAKEPHFISFADGVPSRQEPGNDEMENTWVIVTGLYIEGLDQLPPYIWDIFDKKNPLTVRYAERTEADTSIISTGILHGTFEGTILGQQYLFPKHAVNSLEFYDGHINPGGTDKRRKGSSSEVNAHIYHSPDYHLYGRRARPDYAIYELNMSGKGYRHKLYSPGKDPERWTQKKVNLAGATYGINLNKYTPGSSQVQCVKGIEEALFNSVVGKDGSENFTLSLCNLMREGSQYVEFEGAKIPIANPTDAQYGSLDGGDGSSDESFVGDGIDHEAVINNVGAHMVTFARYVPHQYGSSISCPYIPTGIEITPKEVAAGRVEGIFGDSWVGPFTYRRTALVSDKVIPDMTREIGLGNLSLGNLPGIIKLGLQIVQTIFDDGFKNFARILGFQEIGTVPKSHDKDDVRNLFCNLRATMRGGGPIGQPSGGPFEDCYYAQTASGYNHTILPSDANLNFRGTGIVDLRKDGVAEVHRRKLKGMVIDTTMPEGTDNERSWLDRGISTVYIEPSKLQMLARIVLNILWTYGIGGYFWFLGIKLMMDALLDIGLFSLLSTAVSMVFAVLWFTIGTTWIRLWSNTDIDNKIIDKIVGIEFVYPDKFFKDSPGSQYGMKPGRIPRNENNYWYYNPDFSSRPHYDIVLGIPNYFDPLECHNTNKIVASLPQIPSSPIDAFRQFRPTHYLYIPKSYGLITRLVSIGGDLYAHTTDQLVKISYSAEPRNLSEQEMLIGRFNLFGKPYAFYASVMEGYGGNLDPNASYITPAGYFYIDRMSRRLKRFAPGGGNGDVKLSDVETFYNENLTFYGPGPYDQKNEDGQWFDMGFDHGSNMLYIYKKDIDDKSFMLSLDMNTMAYLSRHMWKPELFLNDRYKMYTIKNGKLAAHRAPGVFGNIHGDQYASYVEIPFHERQFHNSIQLRSIKIMGEVIQHNPDGTREELDIALIDKIMIYNGRQTSGWRELRETDTHQGAGTNSEKRMESRIEAIKQDSKTKWQRKGNGLIIEEFFNVSPVNKIFNIRNKELNIVDTNWPSTGPSNGSFEDDYFVLRLYFKKQKNVQVILRKIIADMKTSDQQG